MELSGYIAVIRRWWWTLLVAAWIAGLTGFLVASQIPPTYESRVSLLVGPINTDQNTLRASGQLVQTYAQLVTTAPLLDSAIQETGLPITSSELVPLIRATANDVTRILSIRVQSGSPEDAATIANAIATELIQLASRGIGRPEGQVQIIEPAAIIPLPVAPQVSILVLLAAGAGLIGALVIVLLIEYLSDSVRSREDLVRTSGATPLGVVGTGGTELIAMPSGRVGQSYLLLAAKLVLAGEVRDTASILVLDATTTRTASVVSANLAAAIGRLGRKAIVIDGAPGQQGGLTRLFGLEGRTGVSDFLVGSTTRDLASMAEGINIVPSGTIDLPAIDVDRCRELVATVSKSYDVVLVATAPVTESAIATVWARACDGAMLIAERDHSRRTDVALATESLALVERPLIGVVLAERGRSLRGRARAVDSEPPRPAAVRVRAPARPWDADMPPRATPGAGGSGRSGEDARREEGPSRSEPGTATIATLRAAAARPPDALRAATRPTVSPVGSPVTPIGATRPTTTSDRPVAPVRGLSPTESPIRPARTEARGATSRFVPAVRPTTTLPALLPVDAPRSEPAKPTRRTSSATSGTARSRSTSTKSATTKSATTKSATTKSATTKASSSGKTGTTKSGSKKSPTSGTSRRRARPAADSSDQSSG